MEMVMGFAGGGGGVSGPGERMPCKLTSLLNQLDIRYTYKLRVRVAGGLYRLLCNSRKPIYRGPEDHAGFRYVIRLGNYGM